MFSNNNNNNNNSSDIDLRPLDKGSTGANDHHDHLNPFDLKNQQNFSSLLEHARSGYTRGPATDSLELGDFDKLYKNTAANAREGAANAREGAANVGDGASGAPGSNRTTVADKAGQPKQQASAKSVPTGDHQASGNPVPSGEHQASGNPVPSGEHQADKKSSLDSEQSPKNSADKARTARTSDTSILNMLGSANTLPPLTLEMSADSAKEGAKRSAAAKQAQDSGTGSRMDADRTDADKTEGVHQHPTDGAQSRRPQPTRSIDHPVNRHQQRHQPHKNAHPADRQHQLQHHIDLSRYDQNPRRPSDRHQNQHHQSPAKEKETHTAVGETTKTVERGDNLWTIARQHLGPDASKAEVQNHLQDIARLNHMTDAHGKTDANQPLHEGQQLKLPGQTNDGGFVTTDERGNKTTQWKDGTQKVENSDKTGFVKHADSSEHHWGPHHSDNFDRTPDGRTTPVTPEQPQSRSPEKPQSGDKTEAPHSQTEARKSNNLEQQKRQLNKTLDEAKDIPQKTKDRLHHSMDAFEKRAKADHMSPQEVAKMYEQITRLLESEGNTPISRHDKITVADQILQHAAHPYDIDQGNHGTCGPASLETRLFKQSPSKASGLIADVATTGQYTATDGSTVKLNAQDFRKDGESRHNPPLNGERSYASKLFQTTALDLHYQKNGERFLEEPGKAGQKGANTPVGKDSECVVDRDGNKRPSTGVNIADVADMEEKITGEKVSGHYLANEKSNGTAAENGYKALTFKNQQDFADHLKAAKNHGELPLTLWVHSGQPPFDHEGGLSAGGKGGGHFVTVTDFDEKKGTVSFDNQWGEQADHVKQGVPLHQLYEATYDHHNQPSRKHRVNTPPDAESSDDHQPE